MKTCKIKKSFLDTLEKKCGASGKRILVALSGGPDSVALLHLLASTRENWRGELAAAHINHQLRPAANKDEKFCHALCEQLDIPLETVQIDVVNFAKAKKLSIETAARELRYRELNKIREKIEFDYLALGHHADDQAETVLGNLVRGTGLRGLAGMPYKYRNRIRPLLKFRSKEILEYLNEQDIEFRIDKTNVDTKFRRNDIRHNLLPQLERKFNPQIRDSLSRLAQISYDAETYLVHQAAVALQEMTIEETPHKIVLDIERFWHYFVVLQKYALRLAIEKISQKGLRPNYNDLERILTCLQANKIGMQVPLHGKWEALIDRDVLVIRETAAPEFNFELQIGSAVRHESGWQIQLSEQLPADIDPRKYATPYIQFIDHDKITGTIRVRNLQTGDYFYPLGLGGKKSVSDYFTDRKVPLHKRGDIPLVASGDEIIWVTGFHLDERYKISSQTTSILKLEFKDQDL